jgi:hypothetical protein
MFHSSIKSKSSHFSMLFQSDKKPIIQTKPCFRLLKMSAIKQNNPKMCSSALQRKKSCGFKLLFSSPIQPANDDVYNRNQKILAKGELISFIEMSLEQDYGKIPGAERLKNAIKRIADDNMFWQSIQGYWFQLREIEKELRNDALEAVEVLYIGGATGGNRRVDIVLKNGTYIEIKGYASDYNPPVETQYAFRQQALDYSQSNHLVEYRFRNNPPNWVAQILNQYGLNYVVVD